ncbi:MAG: DNA helicase RecQ [Verrucomicrobia bacterium]|nr:DNA helicase RecQ [Verrucomicrobiota bacterium]
MNSGNRGLHSLLQEVFGFTAFRPLQEDIIRDALGGRDVFAVLPTGGGKSLCFQLPAVARTGLTVVVSPLIALMKDQVDGLRAIGVPATCLNSSVASGESRVRVRGLHQGEFRLLYVAPERLMMSGFLEDLKGWRVCQFVIDEAHCISEWGHDFRPEYRQLAAVRGSFPDAPVMALTATATERVRADILKQLNLRDPACYVASFNRPNLTYRVAGKAGAYGQVLDFIRARAQDSGIVYCQSRKTAETLAARLSVDGVAAGPYHAGMTPEERTRNQESFLRDELRVVCATIAFGMGINKPNVRFVIHYDLPKNIEGYYQETGRAGRDGLPSECLLLFSPADRVKYGRFIEEKPDPQEREIARAQLEQMIGYAEAAACRRAFLLGYFGERFPANGGGPHKAAGDAGHDRGCNGCDNCLAPRDTFDGTLAAQKFLSCVYRIREKSGFGVGVQHVVEVLCGADTERMRKWSHQSLSTYGIGKEHSRAEWSLIGRELVRMGCLAQDARRFNVLELTDEGKSVLRSKRPVRFTRPVAALPICGRRAGEIACDEVLFERLRVLRKRLADERGVPPYVVFGDVSLRQMARHYPATEAELARISGVGEHKRREFGTAFLAEVAAHLAAHPRRDFPDSGLDGVASGPQSGLADTVRETVQLFRQGRTVREISELRQFKESTIYGHLEAALLAGVEVDVRLLISPEAQDEIAAALRAHGQSGLSAVFDALDGRYSYGQLRLVRAAG